MGVANMTHDMKEYSFDYRSDTITDHPQYMSLRPMFLQARGGDQLRLEMVSAPWPGWEVRAQGPVSLSATVNHSQYGECSAIFLAVHQLLRRLSNRPMMFDSLLANLLMTKLPANLLMHVLVFKKFEESSLAWMQLLESQKRDNYAFKQHELAIQNITNEGGNPGETSRSYSSVWSNDSVGDGHARSCLGSPQSWSAAHNDKNQWMQIDLGSTRTVRGVYVQARAKSKQRVTVVEISVRQSPDEDAESERHQCCYGDDRFPYIMAKITLAQPRRGRYVVLCPSEWRDHVSMRAGVMLALE